MAAHGATPDIVTPLGINGAGTTVLSIVLPATVLEVCTPWPKPGLASGSGPAQKPLTSVALQSTAISFGFEARKPHTGSFANNGLELLVPPSRSPKTMPSPLV